MAGHAPRVPLGRALILAAMVAAAVWCAAPASLAEGAMRFYAPLDEHARGVLLPENIGLEAAADFEPAAGKVGGACALTPAGLTYALPRFLSNEEGTIAVWLKINWDPAEVATRVLIDLGRFASLRRWQEQQYLTFSLWYHHLDEKHDYSGTAPLTGWQPGQWRHVAMTWSWTDRERAIYIDGVRVGESPIQRPPNTVTKVQIGPDAEAADELCIFSAALMDDEVRELCEAGVASRPAYDVAAIPPALGAVATLPGTAAPPPPDSANWSLEGAEQRDNGLRGEVTLHGVWRWQRGTSAYEPPVDDAWLYRNVPAQCSYANSFPARDAAGEALPTTDPRVDHRNLNEVPQWCEREFTPPPQWRDRRLVLRVDSLALASAVWLNGKLLAALPEQNLGGDWDITDLLTWDKPNRLTIYSQGVDGDVTLVSTPSGPRLADAWLETSWRRKAVSAHLRVSAPQEQRLRLQVDIYPVDADPDEGAAAAKSFSDTRTVRTGNNDLELAAKWQYATPWSLTQPHLYQYVARLETPAGDPLDATLPQRFGFREIWVQGGDFMLNGRPVHFIGHSNAHVMSAAEEGDPGYLRYSLTQWRKAGINAVTPWQGAARRPTLHPLLDIADEMGMAILPIPWLPTGTYETETPKQRAEWERLHRRYIERYRRHPSVLAWMLQCGSHALDFCPAALDGHLGFEQDPNGAYTRTLQSVAAVDPTRPGFGISSGDLGAAWTTMGYQGFDVDLQERENWPSQWARTRHKPLMPCEFSLPYYRDWFARTPRRSGQAQYSPQGTQSLATEYGAMYLGPDAYDREPEEYLASLQKPPGDVTKSQAFWDTKLLFADTLRAWRAWGISFIYHAEVPALFSGDAPPLPTVGGLDPRRFGATPASLHGSLQARDELSDFGKRVQEATAPQMAFIGGPDGRFTLKDHAYWSGETVRKALVIVNDANKTLALDADWVLRGADGQAAARRSLTATVAAGCQERERAVIRFKAPPVQQRTDFQLVVTARGLDLDVSPLALTVFPKEASPPATQAGAVIFDPVGDTEKALRNLGVEAQPLPERLSATDRLIVGRNALSDAADRERLADAGFDEAVAGGMKALVFEQAPAGWDGTVLGLRLKRLATRRAFVRAAGHPVLEGLAGPDFTHLRGDSDMLPPHADPDPETGGYPEHFWHWGNDNIVATHTIEKPQVGACRALLDCGFDLAEAALLESVRGDGTLLFCQVDVTNRIGQDPVSARLALNLLQWLHAPSPRPDGVPLEDLQRQRQPAEQFVGWRAPVPPLPGLHAGDLFFREELTLPAYATAGDAPHFARIETDRGAGWVISLTAEDLPTAWQRAKLGRIEAALRLANRERVTEGPALSLGDDPERLYPRNWRRLPEMDDNFDPYTYWRW